MDEVNKGASVNEEGLTLTERSIKLTNPELYKSAHWWLVRQAREGVGKTEDPEFRFTSEDLIKFLEMRGLEPEKTDLRWIGGMFRSARRMKIITRIGYLPAKRATRGGSPVAVYTSGPAARLIEFADWNVPIPTLYKRITRRIEKLKKQNQA